MLTCRVHLWLGSNCKKKKQPQNNPTLFTHMFLACILECYRFALLTDGPLVHTHSSSTAATAIGHRDTRWGFCGWRVSSVVFLTEPSLQNLLFVLMMHTRRRTDLTCRGQTEFARLVPRRTWKNKVTSLHAVFNLFTAQAGVIERLWLHLIPLAVSLCSNGFTWTSVHVSRNQIQLNSKCQSGSAPSVPFPY